MNPGDRVLLESDADHGDTQGKNVILLESTPLVAKEGRGGDPQDSAYLGSCLFFPTRTRQFSISLPTTTTHSLTD